MRKCERYKAEFLRPKKSNWFGRKEYKAVTKGKILGFTAANGAQLFVRCPSPWNSGAFAKLVRKRVGPFFQRAFPHRRTFRILLDSEPLLHTEEATAALSEFGITAMSGWPKYSPDLNPQENVWSWLEKAVRDDEQKSDTYAVFCRRLLRVAQRYPGAAGLIGTMTDRIQKVLDAKGGMTKY